MSSFYYLFFFCKQKTADEMRISDWSSDVCSSDLGDACRTGRDRRQRVVSAAGHPVLRAGQGPAWREDALGRQWRPGDDVQWRLRFALLSQLPRPAARAG